jgi:hypothetical protein
MIFRLGFALLLGAVALNASATLITANKLEVGTNVSNIASNASVSIVISSKVGSEFVTDYHDAFVLSNPPGSTLATIGCDASGAMQNGGSMLEGSWDYDLTLDDMLSHKYGYTNERSAMMLISYVEPTRKLSYQAVDWYGDGLVALAFDKDKNFIGDYNATDYIDDYEPQWGEMNPVRRYNQTNYFSTDVYYVLLGGYYASAYITGIDTSGSVSVPESGFVALLLIGLLGLSIRHRKVKIK